MTDDQELLLETIVEPKSPVVQWIQFVFPIMDGAEFMRILIPTELTRRDAERLKALIDTWPQR